jgi:hypothetical protein
MLGFVILAQNVNNPPEKKTIASDTDVPAPLPANASKKLKEGIARGISYADEWVDDLKNYLQRPDSYLPPRGRRFSDLSGLSYSSSYEPLSIKINKKYSSLTVLRQISVQDDSVPASAYTFRVFDTSRIRDKKEITKSDIEKMIRDWNSHKKKINALIK